MLLRVENLKMENSETKQNINRISFFKSCTMYSLDQFLRMKISQHKNYYI
jgi:hypothetical protein